MKFALSAFSQLPLSFKVASAVLGGGSLLGLVYLTFPEHFWIIMIGLIMVGVCLGLYGYIIKLQRKRRAAPMEQGLLGNTSATPQGISAASSMARLDDLRKKFEEGLEKFRAAGKNIYSLPWYALVGEPGSGKTEAIRHCNVGFPPGLQDQLQGSGGTLNMNWWFTNHAVIIDTAGRLMFEEVQPGSTNEWEEFLKLLKANRPNCPINGMLLTISAESLIKDTADDLERKGGKIAQQLDNIQRMLGVRFPVFIMITKCDLINGFREFFEDLTDPQLQHQVLGWSNPAQLDEPFNPGDVEQHLEKVKGHLLRRRMRLLLDPVSNDNPDNRRTDEVDALYAFPNALSGLAPRLKRYLEMIFVAGEWSSKPLFLRGIYFTSAMREGEALDADLADMLGVPVDSLPEGRVWEQDRAYFLRDLFLKKVFKEKGLVTRATNTRQLQRQRKGVVLGTGLGSLALFFLLTGFGATQLKKSIGSQLDLWSAIEDRFVVGGANPLKIVDQPFPGSPYEYSGQTILNLDGTQTTLGEFPGFCREIGVEKKISIPIVFQPLRLVKSIATEGFNTGRRKAMRVIIETSFLEPVFEAAKANMLVAKPEAWSEVATYALAEMSRLFVLASSEPTLLGGGLSGDGPEKFDPDLLFRFVLVKPKNEEEYLKYKADDASFQDAVRWVYSSRGGDQPWPPRAFGRDPEVTLQAISAGVDAFSASWTRLVEGQVQDNLLSQLVSLKDGLKAFQNSERTVQRLGDDLASDISTLGVAALAKEWRDAIDTMAGAKGRIDSALQLLGDQIDQPIDVLCNQARDEVLGEGAVPAYDRLLASLSDEGRKGLSDDLRTRLATIRSKLKGENETLNRTVRSQVQELEENLPRLARLLLAKTPQGDVRLYQIDFDMYQHADAIYRDGIEAVGELITKYKSFPLCRTTDLRQELSIDRAQTAFVLLNKIKGTQQAAAENLATAALRQGGGVAFYKQVKEKLERIVNTGRALVIGDHQDWYEQLEAIQNALHGSEPLTCELVVLPFTEQKHRPNIEGLNLRDTPLTPHRYFEVFWGDRLIGQRMQTDHALSDVEPTVFSIPGKKVSFRFFDHLDAQAPDAVADADNPWTIIKALHTLDAEANEDDKQVWKVALIMKDTRGANYYYWVGLKFNRPIPELDDWPTEESWPKP